MTIGVIYVAIGEQFIEEALQSITSLKAVMPKVSTTIYCDQELKSTQFDDVVIINDNNLLEYPGLAKITALKNSPYTKGIFLDTDTYVCDDFSELFTLLDHFDIATAHAPVRDATKVRKDMNYSINVPESFPEMNTGVIAFRKNELTENLFDAWFEACQEKLANVGKPLHDQTSFREVLYFSDVRVATLTPEYNFRLSRKGFAIGKVKILHGRHPNLSSVAKKINQFNAPRTYKRESDVIKINSEDKNFYHKLKKIPRKIYTYFNLNSQ